MWYHFSYIKSIYKIYIWKYLQIKLCLEFKVLQFKMEILYLKKYHWDQWNKIV